MAKKKDTTRYVLCLNNQDYPVSLEVRKIYKCLPDPTAKSRGFIRVIDESGSDYLYPAADFVAIAVPAEATVAFSGPLETPESTRRRR
jgi:hypothetical protein